MVKLFGESNEVRLGEYGLIKISAFFIFFSDLLISFIFFSLVLDVTFCGLSFAEGNNLLYVP